MKIDIICVGGIKESFFREAISEFVKRLRRYCDLQILEVRDEKTPDKASDLENENIKSREAERILEKIHSPSYVIALAIEGEKADSLRFAKLLEDAEIHGRGQITLIIGGSLGLSKKVLQRADCLLSFSDMTFPHQLMRLILLEQVYRSFRIRRNEPYHK